MTNLSTDCVRVKIDLYDYNHLISRAKTQAKLKD